MDSLNQHAAQYNASKIISTSKETVVSQPELTTCNCGKDGCPNKATYLSNFMCQERLLCDAHAKIFMSKNSQLPVDMWFCRLLVA